MPLKNSCTRKTKWNGHERISPTTTPRTSPSPRLVSITPGTDCDPQPERNQWRHLRDIKTKIVAGADIPGGYIALKNQIYDRLDEVILLNSTYSTTTTMVKFSLPTLPREDWQRIPLSKKTIREPFLFQVWKYSSSELFYKSTQWNYYFSKHEKYFPSELFYESTQWNYPKTQESTATNFRLNSSWMVQLILLIIILLYVFLHDTIHIRSFVIIYS